MLLPFPLVTHSHTCPPIPSTPQQLADVAEVLGPVSPSSLLMVAAVEQLYGSSRWVGWFKSQWQLIFLYRSRWVGVRETLLTAVINHNIAVRQQQVGRHVVLSACSRRTAGWVAVAGP